MDALDIIWKMINNEDYKKNIRKSITDKTIYDSIIKIRVGIDEKEFNEKKKLLEDIVYDRDDKDIIVTFNHKKTDGMQLLQKIYPELAKKMDIKVNDILLYNILPLQQSVNIKKYAENLLLKPCIKVEEDKNSYGYVKISKKELLIKKEKLGIKNTSSFLMALQIYNYYQMTNCDFIKVGNVIYLPMIDGINKIIKHVMIIEPKGKTFLQIYKDVEKYKVSHLDMWGLYYWLSYYDNFIKPYSKIILGDKEQELNDDILFSNIPISVGVNKLEIISFDRKKNNNNNYIFGIGDKNNDINLSFISSDRINNFHQKYNELFKNL